jgi:hypothetical protein
VRDQRETRRERDQTKERESERKDLRYEGLDPVRRGRPTKEEEKEKRKKVSVLSFYIRFLFFPKSPLFSKISAGGI